MHDHSAVVFELAEQFMKTPKYVELDYETISTFGDTMKKTVKRKFYPPKHYPNQFSECLTHLVASSINYCFFYGRHDIRPKDASSTRMYEIVEREIKEVGRGFLQSDTKFLEGTIDSIVSTLSLERFPLIEERKKHLTELVPKGYEFTRYVIQQAHNDDYNNVQMLMGVLIENFPGFSSDLFLKRASLFFLMLSRRFGWFKDALKNVHVPADYQVPKLLEFFGLIKYSDELKLMLENNILIPKHSQIECEIRAATILTCKELCKLTEWNVSEVDAWFWLRRKECNRPFHLIITTDY